MVSKSKLLTLLITSFLVMIAASFASPIVVEDIEVKEVSGDYLVLVTLDNQNVNTGKYTELEFELLELSSSKTIDGVKVGTNESQVMTYDLSQVTDRSRLKLGESYQLKVTADGTSRTASFHFGPKESSDGLGLAMKTIELNSQEVSALDTLQVLNGETLNVRLAFTALENFNDARFTVFVEGYEHSTLMSSTDIFSVVEGKTYVKTLSINLPSDMSSQKDYKLRIVGSNDLSGLTYKELDLYVDTQRDRVDVLDLVFTPSSGVEPGQNAIAQVRLKNRGQQDQESVKVSVVVENLGIVESSYISNLNPNEAMTSDDMLLYIPEDAKAGDYEVKVNLAYNDGYTSSTKVYKMTVLSPKAVDEKSLIVSTKQNLDLKSGEASSFNVVIANQNAYSKPVSLVPVQVAWADVEVTPSLVMITAGGDASYTVTVTPKAAVEGEKELKFAVKDGVESSSEIAISVYVEKGSTNTTNIILGVLIVVALLVLFALVVSIAKRKNNDGDEDVSSEEYY